MSISRGVYLLSSPVEFSCNDQAGSSGEVQRKTEGRCSGLNDTHTCICSVTTNVCQHIGVVIFFTTFFKRYLKNVMGTASLILPPLFSHTVKGTIKSGAFISSLKLFNVKECPKSH